MLSAAQRLYEPLMETGAKQGLLYRAAGGRTSTVGTVSRLWEERLSFDCGRGLWK